MYGRRVDADVTMPAEVRQPVGGTLMLETPAPGSGTSAIHQPKVTISGSFRRSWPEVTRVREEFVRLGAMVLSPPPGEAVGVSRGFTRLAGDPSARPQLTESRHLDAIANSDFLWVVPTSGEFGQSTTLEVGFALARGVPVLSADTIGDSTMRALISKVSSPRSAVAAHASGASKLRPTLLVDPSTTIDNLRHELDSLEQLLEWGDGPMSLEDSDRVIESVVRIRTALGVIGKIAR